MDMIWGLAMFASIVIINGLIGMSILPRLRYLFLIKASIKSNLFNDLPFWHKLSLIILFPGDTVVIMFRDTSYSLYSYEMWWNERYLDYINYQQLNSAISGDFFLQIFRFFLGLPFFCFMLLLLLPVCAIFMLIISSLCGLISKLKTIYNYIDTKLLIKH